MRHTWILATAAVLALGATALADAHDGRLRAWIVTPRGEVDGIVLSDHASVRFSERTGRFITQRLRLGDRVEVSSDGQTLMVPQTGWSTDLGLPGASLGRGGGPIAIPVPMGARADRAGDGIQVSSGPVRGTQHFSIQGRVADLTHTRARAVDGFVIQGGITVRVPPARAASVASLHTGASVSVEGDGVRGPQGIGLTADRVTDDHGAVLFSAQ